MPRIIILGNEPELLRLARAINNNNCGGQADVIMYNDAHIGEKTVTDDLFLIGHGSAQEIGEYDFKGLTTHFGQHMLSATNSVYLAGCSTDNQQQLIQSQGTFYVLTIAANVKQWLRDNKKQTKVYGAPGTLRRTGNPPQTPDVLTVPNAHIIYAGKVWVEA